MEVDDAQHEESAGDPAPEQGTGEMMGGGEAGGDHHKQQQQQQQNQGHQQGKGEEETFVRKDVRPQWPPEQETRKQSTIVIQPGSEYLRIGWAGDEAPRVVPHCLARLYRGDMEEPASSAPERERERERELADVERTVRKWSGPTQKRSGLGGETVEEEIADAGQEEAFKLLGVEGGEEGGAPRKVFYGEEAQKVTKARRMDGSRYVMKRLVQRGRVHVTSDGVEAALCDFQGVWEHAIRDVMGHDLSQLENNLCVLVIPSNVCKMDVKFYMTLLLQRMRCRGVCVLQDSVSACYASVCT
jgi:actin-related protein 8